jgi:CheY-like chemotaxis protein
MPQEGVSNNERSAMDDETTLLPGEKSDPHFADRCPLRILLVDDNYINRRLLLLMLRSLGYQPAVRENGRESLEAVIEGDYDLLLTDLDMPEMGGIESALAIREAGIGLPIIAITASSPEITREDCFAAGMNGFMRKPISRTELKRAIQEVSLIKWMNHANLAIAAAI